ncbi:hypothetical protein BCR44DRAFT_55466 [Catenaria anguillulae PL171]|uniref:UBL3-like ubiquitin domain-containing protein n=1 Tax=Catenaria anguillulae PL171 TaxID=765915 RepID=A0A1Y2HGG9_9FUNG|nr:hypothetical protein BCR44DRAFT_55466 [Catenaria anguillulae PL171]
MSQEAAAPHSGPAPQPGKVGITLLFVNSQRKEGLFFEPTDTVESVAKHTIANWPTDVTVEKPEIPAQVRLLHRGRFLEGPGALAADHKLPVGEVTIVHIVIKAREVVEERSPDAPKPKADEPSSSKCCIIL